MYLKHCGLKAKDLFTGWIKQTTPLHPLGVNIEQFLYAWHLTEKSFRKEIFSIKSVKNILWLFWVSFMKTLLESTKVWYSSHLHNYISVRILDWCSLGNSFLRSWVKSHFTAVICKALRLYCFRHYDLQKKWTKFHISSLRTEYSHFL